MVLWWSLPVSVCVALRGLSQLLLLFAAVTTPDHSPVNSKDLQCEKHKLRNGVSNRDGELNGINTPALRDPELYAFSEASD